MCVRACVYVFMPVCTTHQLHGVVSRKTFVFTVTTMRNPNPAEICRFSQVAFETVGPNFQVIPATSCTHGLLMLRRRAAPSATPSCVPLLLCSEERHRTLS